MVSLRTSTTVIYADASRQLIAGTFVGKLARTNGMKDCGNGLFDPDIVELPLSGGFFTHWLKF